MENDMNIEFAYAYTYNYRDTRYDVVRDTAA
jgi:hypothetical protein